MSWKCLVACLPVEESQQPTWPHAWHSRRATQNVPSTRHSSHALGVFGGGKLSAVSPLMCSHDSAIASSSFLIGDWFCAHPSICFVTDIGPARFEHRHAGDLIPAILPRELCRAEPVTTTRRAWFERGLILQRTDPDLR